MSSKIESVTQNIRQTLMLLQKLYRIECPLLILGLIATSPMFNYSCVYIYKINHNSTNNNTRPRLYRIIIRRFRIILAVDETPRAFFY